ncbi:MAG TPA: hypothetical protein VHV49_21870 [Pseudonocardiaceae bacterium]|jgi:hypothetical protein|nr:hypothetical protein [Pseudonocardiaceae bacterium]
MTNRWTDPSAEDMHRGLVVAAVALVLAGAVVGAAGVAVAGVAVVASGRRWSRRVEMRPVDLAKLKWVQARAAADAVAGAWRDAEKTADSH